MEMVLKELSTKEKDTYVFKEQTITWKDPSTNEYKYYVSVILETHGWNRFDYSAFDYGHLPEKDIDVILQTIEMKEKKTFIKDNQYILDYSIWNPEYKKCKMKLSQAF